jgi:hypothetical protein
MIYGIKKISRYLLGIDKAGRNLAIFPDDTFLVSFPRSGNTWMRFLMANLLFPEENVSFANIERLIPDTSSQSSRALKRTPRPRIIKSHEYLDVRYPRVIYLVRDPRDTALSNYHFQRKYRQIPDNYPIQCYVEDFVLGRLVSRDWGTWGQNVASWIYTCREKKSFLLVRYEDLIADSVGELSRVARFLGMDHSAADLSAAVQRSSAQRMRRLERKEADVWVATRKRRQDIPFIGSATAGNWQQQLPPLAVKQIEFAWGELMLRLGYQLSPNPAIEYDRVLLPPECRPILDTNLN